MKLDEYLRKEGITATEFAGMCGMHFHKIYRALRGIEPTLKTAAFIEEFTKKQVTASELINELTAAEILNQLDKAGTP